MLSEKTPCMKAACPLPSAKRARTNTTLEVPGCHAQDGVEKPLPWQLQGRRFNFVVDCKPLQRVSCGLSPLLSANLTIADNVGWMFGKGWLLAKAWDDPVLWQRCPENVIADYLANWIMDTRKSWFEVFDWPFQGRTLDECNLWAHSDGGSRHTPALHWLGWWKHVSSNMANGFADPLR